MIKDIASGRRLASKDVPDFELNVITGVYSDPLNTGYDWEAISMSNRMLELQVDFDKSLYISREEEPEYL